MKINFSMLLLCFVFRVVGHGNNSGTVKPKFIYVSSMLMPHWVGSVGILFRSKVFFHINRQSHDFTKVVSHNKGNNLS